MKICLYAASSTAWFFRALVLACDKAGDDVEWSVVFPQGHFRHALSDIVPEERRCYLYENFAARYTGIKPKHIDDAFEAGEGLGTALMKDKDGYRWLGKEEQLRRGATIHLIYREFLERMRPDYILFPDVESVDGFLLIDLCRSLGIGVLYHVSMRILERSFLSEDSYETLPPYFGVYSEQDIDAARSELRKFIERRSRGPATQYPESMPPKPPLWRRAIASELVRLKYERLHVSEDSLALRIKRNMRPLLRQFRRMRFEVGHVHYFDLAGPDTTLPQNFIFYALHYTPESSINGLEPYYVDQMRVIDALLLNLPKGHRLVVKEHPAMLGLRPAAFYRELRRRPGLVLAAPAIDTRELIRRAALTATVTGTIGLECFLLGKPCLSFGRNFFRHLCHSPPALGELRSFMNDIVGTHMPPSEEKKEIEIAKLLNVGADFLISDPWQFPSVMSDRNIAAARTYLWQHLARMRAARTASS